METASLLVRNHVAQVVADRELSRHDIGSVVAYVNHGRWVADCTDDNGAELVEPGERFLCGSCGAEADVVWPDDIPAAEAVLRVRPLSNRHWYPQRETVSDLAAENTERGL